MSEPWGGSGVPGLPGTAPSAQRALCPSGKEWSRSGLRSFLFHAKFKAQPPPPHFQAAWLGKSVVGVVPVGDLPALGFSGSSRHSTLKRLSPGRLPPPPCVILCPGRPGPPFIPFVQSLPCDDGKMIFQIVSLESREPGA